MINVFLADDDEWILNEMTSIIDWRQYGFNIVGQACDGKNAYNLILVNKPDILFTDIVMPNLTGLELMDKIGRASYRERV